MYTHHIYISNRPWDRILPKNYNTEVYTAQHGQYIRNEHIGNIARQCGHFLRNWNSVWMCWKFPQLLEPFNCIKSTLFYWFVYGWSQSMILTTFLFIFVCLKRRLCGRVHTNQCCCFQNYSRLQHSFNI